MTYKSTSKFLWQQKEKQQKRKQQKRQQEKLLRSQQRERQQSANNLKARKNDLAYRGYFFLLFYAKMA